MRILIFPLVFCAFLSSAFAAEKDGELNRTLLLEIRDIPAEEQQDEGNLCLQTITIVSAS